MPWQLIDKPSIIKLTRKVAQEWVDLPCLPQDRKLKDWRVAYYKTCYEGGTFRPPSWAKCLCEEDNVIYRMNGNHTAHMILSLEEAPDLFVAIESYSCDLNADLPGLYATFDNRVQSRSNTDIVHVYAASHPALAVMPARVINLLASGIGFAVWGINSYSKQASERAEAMLVNVDFCLWFFDNFAENQNSIIWRSPVTAAMMLTWQKNKKDALTFWLGVRNEDDPDPDAPTRVLARWLREWAVNHGRGTIRALRRQAQPREFFVKSIHAWNAWRKKESTTLRYYVDKDIPKIL